MLISKKYLALCATGLIGFGVATPVATSVCADQKSGETTITYQTEAKPAEWGLSVPARVELDKVAKGITAAGGDVLYGNAKIAIVNAEGQDLVGTTSSRTFSVSGKGTGDDGNLAFKEQDGLPSTAELYAKFVNNQGDAEPTTMSKETWDNSGIQPKFLSTSFDVSDNTAKPERWLQFSVSNGQINTEKTYNEKVSWTATEN